MTYTHTILIELLMMVILQGLDPMAYIKFWFIIKGLMTFQKRDSILAPSELDGEVSFPI